jgi:hypothetical protein
MYYYQCIKKKSQNAKSDSKFDKRWRMLIIPITGKKGSRMPYWLAFF